MEKQKGKFIVLEGVDGSGISTQTSLLRTWLEKNSDKYGRTFFTKEPTDGPVGGQIRLALAKRLKPLDERVMALLFAADRLDHLFSSAEDGQNGGIVHKLDQGVNVVSDRYYLSSLAYQSCQANLEWLLSINSHAIKPDLTILLLLPVAESVQRREKSRFHEELYEKEETLTIIRRNYELIARKLQTEGENIAIIDAARAKELIFADIQARVSALFHDGV